MSSFLKRTFGVMLVFLLLVAALEVLYRILHIPKITHQDIEAKGQRLMPEIGNNTVLIIGDSRLEWGIKPITLFEKYKTAGINCNVVDMAMPGSNGLDVLHYLATNHIYPKLIIHGYAPNYGGYKNHDFDKEPYSAFNKLSAQFSYWLDQNFYFRDQSVLNYLKHVPTYFKEHRYDSLGGATVTEYGDYTHRSNTQYEMYKGFKSSFKQSALNVYCQELNEVIKTFRANNTVICGVYMPISKRIYDLQNLTGTNIPAGVDYNSFYDLGSFTYTAEVPAHDSTFFYDGCHLLPSYAAVFTGKLADSLQKDHRLK